MGFLDFWKTREIAPSQADPAGELAATSEPSRALAHRQFQDEVKQRCGTRYTHMNINLAASEEMLGHCRTRSHQVRRRPAAIDQAFAPHGCAIDTADLARKYGLDCDVTGRAINLAIKGNGITAIATALGICRASKAKPKHPYQRLKCLLAELEAL